MASGQTLLEFTAQANQPPAAAYATPDTRNGLLVLDFDATLAESAIFLGILPAHYGGGGLTLRLVVMASTAVSGTMRWLAAIERHLPGTDDADVDSFAAAKAVAIVAVAPSGTEAVGTFTFAGGAEMDGLVAGNVFRLKITRDAADGSDDMAGDAELVALELRET